jgi:hypothetical protein
MTQIGSYVRRTQYSPVMVERPKMESVCLDPLEPNMKVRK